MRFQFDGNLFYRLVREFSLQAIFWMNASIFASPLEEGLFLSGVCLRLCGSSIHWLGFEIRRFAQESSRQWAWLAAFSDRSRS